MEKTEMKGANDEKCLAEINKLKRQVKELKKEQETANQFLYDMLEVQKRTYRILWCIRYSLWYPEYPQQPRLPFDVRCPHYPEYPEYPQNPEYPS